MKIGKFLISENGHLSVVDERPQGENVKVVAVGFCDKFPLAFSCRPVGKKTWYQLFGNTKVADDKPENEEKGCYVAVYSSYAEEQYNPPLELFEPNVTIPYNYDISALQKLGQSIVDLLELKEGEEFKFWINSEFSETHAYAASLSHDVSRNFILEILPKDTELDVFLIYEQD